MASVKNDPKDIIKIQAFKKAIISFNLVGTAPLMTNRLNALLPGDEGYDDPEKPKKSPLSAEDRFRGACHIISGSWREPENIQFGFPVGAIKKSVVAAGYRFTRRSGTELNGVFRMVGGVITRNPVSFPGLEPSQCQCYPIIGSPPEHDSRGVCIQNKSWNRCHRPRWDSWTIPVTVEYDQAMMEPQDLINLFRRAGFQVGIGVMRAEKGYDFGTFSVEIPEKFQVQLKLV